jgi:hypothetical protein
MNLQFVNFESQSCHAWAFWSFRDGYHCFFDVAHFFCALLIMCFFSFENFISLLFSLSKNPKKKCARGIDPGSCNSVEASDLPVRVWLNGCLIYFQLARGGGLPPYPHLSIYRNSSSGRPAFSLVLLEELVPARRHMERCNPRFWEDGAIGLVVISAYG